VHLHVAHFFLTDKASPLQTIAENSKASIYHFSLIDRMGSRSILLATESRLHQQQMKTSYRLQKSYTHNIEQSP
jgi:hypothetical protein